MIKKASLFAAFILFITLKGTGQALSRWELVKCNCDSLVRDCKIDPCKGLSLISDSSYLAYKINEDCFHRIFEFYSTSTKIAHIFHVEYENYYSYQNFSFGKSMYKYDLLKWIKYYNCPDVNGLTKKKYGKFSIQERNMFSQWNYDSDSSMHVDTTILWEK